MSKVSNPLPLIWAHYGVQLLDQYREQYGPAEYDHTMPLNNPGASTALFIFTSAGFAVYPRIHAAGNTKLKLTV
jgi:hypothetical protein